MTKKLKTLITELASACATTQPELSAQALTLDDIEQKIKEGN